MELLPLFPLGAALLPGQRLPLTVFEPRYVDLLRSLMERPEPKRCFGIVAIRRGHEVGADAVPVLHAIGCEARIDALAASVGFGDPSYQIVVTGTRRFRLEGVLAGRMPDAESTVTPWHRGMVTWLPSVPGPVGQPLADLRRWLTTCTTLIGLEAPELEEHAPDLAARILKAVPTLTVADRQRVLAAETTTEQSEVLLRLLRREVALIHELRAVSGYSPPSPSMN